MASSSQTIPSRGGLFSLSYRKVPTTLQFLATHVTDVPGFKSRYGDLLSLVLIDVDGGLLNTMVQFYDLAHRCFTLRDFQMVPCLKEFAFLLGRPVLDRIPYTDWRKHIVEM